MKPKYFSAFVLFFLFVFAGVSFGTTMTIKMSDGNIITLETSKISSITFSGAPGSFSGGFGDGFMNIAGNWTSTEGGSLTIRQSGSDINGNYPLNNGKITGKLNGNVFEGYWIQDSSGKKCGYPRNGSFYWGKVRLNFTETNYSGIWGYCEDNPTAGWSGNRK